LRIIQIPNGGIDESYLFKNGIIFNGNIIHVENESSTSCKICLSKISFKFSSKKMKIKNSHDFMNMERLTKILIIPSEEKEIYTQFIDQLKLQEISIFLTNSIIENKFKQLFKMNKITCMDGIDLETFQILSKMLKVTFKVQIFRLKNIGE
jgi:hypothetical protein